MCTVLTALRLNSKCLSVITIGLRIFSYVQTDSLKCTKVYIDLLFHRQNILIINFSFTLTEGAGIAQYSEWLRAARQRGQSSSPRESRISSLHSVQTGFGIHSASYPVGTGGKVAGG
jgi:hypothetical protein